MNNPTISIIIPVYNVKDYIAQTLDSILKQTYKDYEVILIDDGSTDGSKEIIEAYVLKYKNFKLFIQENSGPGIARNNGLKVATGEYIAFVDSDDLIPEKSLECRVNAAINEQADLIVGGTHRFNKEREWPLKDHFIGDIEQDVRYSSAIFWTVGPCNKLFKRSLIEGIEFATNINYGEDQVFVLEAYLKANKIYFINEMIYLYRLREEPNDISLTQQNPSVTLKQIVIAWKMIDEKIDQYIDNKYLAHDIKVRYLERLVSIEIWPKLKVAITSRNKEWQEASFKHLIQLFEYLEPEVINKQGKFKWIMSKGIIEKFLFIHRKNRKYAIRIIDLLVSHLDIISRHEYNMKHGYFTTYLIRINKYKSSFPVYQYLMHRRLIRTQEMLKERFKQFCYYGIFNVATKLPVKRHLVVLATNRSRELEGNLKYLSKELEKNDVFNVYVYLNNAKTSNLEIAKMNYRFGRAKYIFIDDYYRQLYGKVFNKKTEVIQLWHACGAFKRFGFSAVDMLDSNPISFEKKAHQHYTKVITSANEVNSCYAEAFNIEEKNVLSLGAPRTDIFLDEAYKTYIVEKLRFRYPQFKNKKIILYAPTFRGNVKDRKKFNCELDYQKMIDRLGDEYILLLKFHPVVNELSVRIPKAYHGRVFNMSMYKDINELMVLSDILITDYSSVVFEFSLLERPMLFFAYDFKEYINERNFYYNYEEFVPGPIVQTTDELIEIIQNETFEIEKIKQFKNKFFDEVDGKASQRIVEYMLNNMKK